MTTAPGHPSLAPPTVPREPLPFLGVSWTLAKHGILFPATPLPRDVNSALFCLWLHSEGKNSGDLVVLFIPPNPGFTENWRGMTVPAATYSSKQKESPLRTKCRKLQNTKAEGRTQENLPWSSRAEEENELSWICGRRTCLLPRPGAMGTRGLWIPGEPQTGRT